MQTEATVFLQGGSDTAQFELLERHVQFNTSEVLGQGTRDENDHGTWDVNNKFHAEPKNHVTKLSLLFLIKSLRLSYNQVSIFLSFSLYLVKHSKICYYIVRK